MVMPQPHNAEVASVPFTRGVSDPPELRKLRNCLSVSSIQPISRSIDSRLIELIGCSLIGYGIT